MKSTEDQIARTSGLLEDEIEAILECIEDLRDNLGRGQQRLAKQEEEHEKARQEQWRIKKELATVKRMKQEYDELAAECDELRGRQSEMRESLRRVLTYTRALIAEHRP